MNNEISLFELISLWKTQQIPMETTVYGVSLLWWGRIGKIALFLGAMTVVAELIGAARIRDFGRQLRNIISDDFSKTIYNSQKRWLYATWLSFISHMNNDVELSEYAMEESRKFRHELVFQTIFFVTLSIVVYQAYQVFDGWWLFVPAGIVGLVVGCVASLLITILFSFTLYFFIVTIDKCLLEPVAWVLEREYLDTTIKILSLLLVVFGSTVDLLMS